MAFEREISAKVFLYLVFAFESSPGFPFESGHLRREVRGDPLGHKHPIAGSSYLVCISNAQHYDDHPQSRPQSPHLWSVALTSSSVPNPWAVS